MIGKAPLTASMAGSSSFLIKFSKATFYSFLKTFNSAMLALTSEMYYLTIAKSASASVNDPSHLSLWAEALAKASYPSMIS